MKKGSPQSALGKKVRTNEAAKSVGPVKPPRQDRSVKTYNALLDAAERLLRDRPWEEISTVAIMLEAGCSNGAIYGRVKSKDDLLVELYERHDRRLKEKFERRKKKVPENGESIEHLLSREIDQLVRTYRENRWLLRAMGLLSRRRPHVVSIETRKERKSMFDLIGLQFLEFEELFDQNDAARNVELGIFFVSTILREAILYQGPHFGTLNLSDHELKASLKMMALRFLGIETAAD
jgi:AcrR family transcriptional regulator